MQWRQWDGESLATVASRLGLAVDAARMRCNRALARLTQQVLRLKDGELGRLLDEADAADGLGAPA